jgi:nascent polypeptide-associated complex subunit beta
MSHYTDFAGPDNLVNLKKIAQQFQRQQSAVTQDEDDDDVPDLVEGESFEEASKLEAAA